MRLLRFARNDGIFAMTDEFRIYCDEIPRSSRGMTKNASPRMTQSGQAGDDTGLGILDGILDLAFIFSRLLLARSFFDTACFFHSRHLCHT